MTPIQEQKIRDKIEKVRKTLLSEKRKYGWFDDSKGLRYLPTELFVKIGDYSGGLKYLNWFNKNFPDDMGLPEFLFESTIILFHAKKITEANAMALKTHFSNTYLFDKYFDRPFNEGDQYTSSSLEKPEYLSSFRYSHGQDNLFEFSHWLAEFITSDKFRITTKEFEEIKAQLRTEPTGPKRTALVTRLHELI